MILVVISSGILISVSSNGSSSAISSLGSSLFIFSFGVIFNGDTFNLNNVGRIGSNSLLIDWLMISIGSSSPLSFASSS